MQKIYKLTAFYKTKTGGNKAGVYINADNLKDEDCQKIAKEVGYSETAFVSKSEIADFKVRFFTPKNQVDLCGHATIATFNLLRDLKIIKPNNIYTQETKAGILQIDVKHDIVFMQQPKPIYSDIIPKENLKKYFKNIEFSDVLQPQIISTGLREIFLPIKNNTVLNQLIPNFEAIKQLSIKHNVIGIHAFALAQKVDAYGRNFAPLIGINEESATGTSNGALACYLYKYDNEKNKFILRQGYSMNQPSEIISKLKTHNQKIIEVWVGGKARIINE
ncbi:MAG: PhzF family phenazine biosynthesis protein [Candidatus Izemoplasmatales bacterium]